MIEAFSWNASGRAPCRSTSNWRAATAWPAVTPFELHIQEVLGLLGNSKTADPTLAESPDFGLECAVETVQPAEQAALELAECPVCGNQWARPRFIISGTSFRIVDCTQCGLGRLYPRPRARRSIRSIRRATTASRGPNSFRSSSARPDRRRKTRADVVPRPHSRCAGARRGLRPGRLAPSLADRGLDVHGFEISAAAAAGADPRAHIRAPPSSTRPVIRPSGSTR